MVTGRVERGRINRGETVDTVGRRASVVTYIEVFKKTVEQGIAGDNAGLLLRGVQADEVERGDIVAAPKSITPHCEFEAEVYVLKKDDGGRHTPFFTGYSPQFFFRTSDVMGTVSLSNVDMVLPGDNVKVRVKLSEPVAMDESLRFAVCEGGRTVGSGLVTKILD